MPVFLLQAAAGSFVVALRCSNCTALAIGRHDERELEAFDRELDRSVASMIAAAEALKTGV